jgi:hypothetical protein
MAQIVWYVYHHRRELWKEALDEYAPFHKILDLSKFRLEIFASADLDPVLMPARLVRSRPEWYKLLAFWRFDVGGTLSDTSPFRWPAHPPEGPADDAAPVAEEGQSEKAKGKRKARDEYPANDNDSERPRKRRRSPKSHSNSPPKGDASSPEKTQDPAAEEAQAGPQPFQLEYFDQDRQRFEFFRTTFAKEDDITRLFEDHRAFRLRLLVFSSLCVQRALNSGTCCCKEIANPSTLPTLYPEVRVPGILSQQVLAPAPSPAIVGSAVQRERSPSVAIDAAARPGSPSDDLFDDYSEDLELP